MTGRMTEAQVLMRIDEELDAKDAEIARLEAAVVARDEWVAKGAVECGYCGSVVVDGKCTQCYCPSGSSCPTITHPQEKRGN